MFIEDIAAIDLERIIGRPVTVLIDKVTHLGSARVDRVVEIVAVTFACRHTVAVHIDEHPIIGEPVAVVIHPVAQFRRVRMGGGRSVITIVTQRVSIAIPVGGFIVRKQPVTIVIDPITDLFRARERARVLVVTVLTRDEPVGVGV